MSEIEEKEEIELKKKKREKFIPQAPAILKLSKAERFDG